MSEEDTPGYGDLIYHCQGIVGYATSEPTKHPRGGGLYIHIMLWSPSIEMWRGFFEPVKNLQVIARKNEWCPDFDTLGEDSLNSKWVR